MDKLISVVVPMYYEEKVVNECYKKLKDVMESCGYDYEIIFVNDGSTDKTLNLLEDIAINDNKIKIIDLARNFGHQIAVTAGINMCKGHGVVVIDSDLQDPPQLILEMIKKWEQGYDVIYAKRKKREGESPFKLLTAKYFYKFLNVMSDIDIPKDTGDFRFMDRKVVDVFNAMSEKNRFIRGMVCWIGFKQTYVEFVRQERYAGESKYPLKKMVKLAEDGIISFSNKPIKLIMDIGVFFLLTSIIKLITIIYKYSVGSKVADWLIITTYMGIIASLLFISLGILGKYLYRVFEQCNERPLYVINNKINMNEEN